MKFRHLEYFVAAERQKHLIPLEYVRPVGLVPAVETFRR
jgi:hypothetical protein